jgi:hypothetical protein
MRRSMAGLLFGLACLSGCAGFAQTAGSAGAPPKVVLWVHQQMLAGKAGERDKLEVEICKKFEEFGIPIPWIEMEAVTGSPGALFLDPASSFEEMDRAGQLLGEAYAAHPELAQLQEEIEERLASSKIVFAVRRDDLGGGGSRIDLSRARYLRINVVSVRPGHESDFSEADKIISRVHADAARAVYAVDSGATLPTFLVIEALRSLGDADKKPEATGMAERDRKQLEQIARDAYTSVESNLYAIHPEMSHVSRGLAAEDPEFWGRK